ncbi:hypothetical protein [Sinomonas albida]|uniref:hypothetical protein n=1 Tax=Sinomonas albida TaxID=369942 RepID=UPI0010A92F1A|nr:hypothetical protein [Sinomonas albida]
MTTNACTVPALQTVPTPSIAALPARPRPRPAGLATARAAAIRAWGWLRESARQAADVDTRLRARRDEDAAQLVRGSGLLGRLY